MCFSATASFSASTLLAATGIVSFTQAKNNPQRILAGIPFIFSVQQFTEGILWLSLMHTAWRGWEHTATYAFQIFAQMLWPVYIPLSILFFEQEQVRRYVILFLLLCGIALSLYTGYAFYTYSVHAFAENHHIRYVSTFPLVQKWYYGLVYFLPTIVAPIVSSSKPLRWLGYLFFISYVGVRLLFHFYEISVWCFFGALISFSILYMICRPLKLNGFTRAGINSL
jgi:hypothetical protein